MMTKRNKILITATMIVGAVVVLVVAGIFFCRQAVHNR